MGCCKSKEKAVEENYAFYKHPPHIMFLGPPGVGKSTLFFRTVMPGWADITQGMEPTKAFYHEVVVRGGWTLNLWDLSGNPALQRSWAGLYRYVKMWAAVYVVSLTDTNPERIARNRADLRALLSDDCLCDSAVVVIMNTFGMAIESVPIPPNEMASRLGLLEAEDTTSAERLSWFVVNAKEGEKDTQWQEALKFLLARFACMLAAHTEGAAAPKAKKGAKKQKAKA
ncbi:putative ADP-ribosylation factor [Besnoitia besnoiti]|uniref:Putative ADP-ribosylation factor n=1 Tax=Besnoitia besnoiti TaxID=94643 RepID=A0A2A9MCN0_BESBE|nr:putative ADP-ribosylation factor [Besnoitia besnoiti]PFH35639.1 putative ADP-ribosylation factor [Besnoitia besnoiti]